jgi:adenine-specific DNA-methyltransferase
MAGENFKTTLEALLKKDNRLVDEHLELNLSIIRDLVDKTDKKLIDLLLSSKEATENFFLSVNSVLIFKQNDFKFFLDSNQLDNSYTSYENRIGLTTNSRLLKETGEVVLTYPYKDCILQGGQSKEEEKDIYYEFNEEEAKYDLCETQRKEIFFNEVLAKNEIDRLFEKKPFTNSVKYSNKGQEKIKKFERDSNGLITDNLIVKGNNLLALHCLKDEFRGRVKLIYIDPPYYFNETKSDDAFVYNSNFKLSTWLTFMLNRIEIAREFLTPDGLIYVQTNEDGQAHLKVLMDSIFSERKFVSQITWQRTPEGRTALGQGSSFIINSTEYILCYANEIKPKINLISKSTDATEKALSQYSSLLMNEGSREYHSTIKDSKGNIIKIYKHENYDYRNIPKITSVKERLKNFKFLVREAAQQQESSLQQKILSSLDSSILFSVEYTPTAGKKKGVEKKAYYINGGILLFLNDYSYTDGERVYRTATMNDFWSHDEIPVTGISEEGQVNLKRGKKPEKLLQRILEMSTVKGDLVMDYHLGSGTTAAVAHKLGLKYIGIEQLDYGDNDSVTRLKNVINGDLSGISTDDKVKWKGGGSFVYLELAKWNAEAKENIIKCKSLVELEKLLIDLSEKYFLNYNVKFKEFQETIIHEENFKKLPINVQQEMFCKMLDLNQLYINVSEMEDIKYKLSKDDIDLTKNFYNL